MKASNPTRKATFMGLVSYVLILFGHVCLYTSSNIIRMISLRGMKWEGHIRHGREEEYIQVLGGNVRMKDY
jgi:hypothetical protein